MPGIGRAGYQWRGWNVYNTRFEVGEEGNIKNLLHLLIFPSVICTVRMNTDT